jgi:hypothetical protein
MIVGSIVPFEYFLSEIAELITAIGVAILEINGAQ